MLAVLIPITAFLTYYTACSHYVASYVGEFYGILWWPTIGYAFLPWPKTATGLVSQMTVPLSQADAQYYNYIIRSGVLIVLTAILWISLSWMVWRIRKKQFTNTQITHSD